MLHFTLQRLIGPLSDKELRVASRRVRSYTLRSGYILVLCFLMLAAWYSIVGPSNPNVAAFGVSRASVMGTLVAGRIIWFQFVAAQLIAAVMMSMSITDETRRGTLSVLLTTPIASGQIVLGKMLTGLLQIVLLLAISLPVLAILRLQGGLSWDFVVAGFCITLSAAVFTGALCLLLSTQYCHPYQVISIGAAVYFVAFAVLPMTSLAWTLGRGGPQPSTWSVLDLANPFYALYKVDPQVKSVRPGVVRGFPWPIHCLILSAITALMLCLSTWRVRRVAAGASVTRKGLFATLLRAWAAPVVWKSVSDRPWWRSRGDLVLAAVILGLCGLIMMAPGPRHMYYFDGAFWLVVLLRLAISAAGGITREKESGAWPILLTTPLDDREIIRTKMGTALRQNALVVLAGLAVHLGFIISVRASNVPSVWIVYLASTFSRVISALFVVCAGLYFGVRLRTTTAAAAAALGAHLCLSYLVGGQLIGMVFRWIIQWDPRLVSRGLWPLYALSFAVTMGLVVLNIALGLLLLRRARQNLRRYVF
jgi:ABC-type transport system involved in multi-copper enzyme maturation permease subunit